jgi:uncharacterized protein (TIGR00251 family)
MDALMVETPFQIRETPEGVEVRLHVQPRAKRSEFAGTHDGALKLKVAAPPVDDAANRAVVDFFASLLDVPKARVRIVSGLKSRDKKIFIEGIPRDRILAALTR